MWVPSAEAFGFSLELNEDVMSEILNDNAVQQLLVATATEVRQNVAATAEATAEADDAANYVASLTQSEGSSDEYGFNFDGPFGLGSRRIAIVGIPSGRGTNPEAKPPLMVEADHHPLTSVPGFTVGGISEDIR